MNRFYRSSHYVGHQRRTQRLGHSFRIAHRALPGAGRIQFSTCSSSRAVPRPVQARMGRTPTTLEAHLTHSGTRLLPATRALGLARPPAMMLVTHRSPMKSRRLRRMVRVYVGWFAKRLVDRAIALVSLVLLSPVMLICALAVKLTSPGPALYSQVRVGLDRRRRGASSANGDDRRERTGYGRPFRIYKFRSMVDGAEKGTGAVWCADGDSRITKLGAFLRRTHLDELPQLINVLRGEMSIVGPRPERPEFVERLVREIPGYRDRSAVLPGITGLAQVKYTYDRNLDTASTKLLYDLYYIRNGGLLLDAKIMAATVAVMAHPDGS